MMMKSKIIISVALLCLFLLTGNASAAVDFPADEAGISAYVKATTSSIDLNDAKSAFASIERETSDYIIGTIALTYHSEEEYPHVYVSTDGWIVAYYPKERERSWIVPWGDYYRDDDYLGICEEWRKFLQSDHTNKLFDLCSGLVAF